MSDTPFVRRFIPTSLFARALLILVIPTVLVQALTAYVFFERHWDNVSRHMAISLAGDVALLVRQYHEATPPERKTLIERAHALMDIDITPMPGRTLAKIGRPPGTGVPDLEHHLRRRIENPVFIQRTDTGENILIDVQTGRDVLRFETSIKRLASATTTIVAVWMVGSATLLLLVATLFMRNQIRPIAALADAAEAFGRGHDMPGFRPQGAREVRQAARAFLVMKERIRRHVATRIDMLAGISHDLRTPLTRMKLHLAMLPESEDTQGLAADVTLMEHMVQEYLDFARGEGKEETSDITIAELLRDISEPFRRQNAHVTITDTGDTTLRGRRRALVRALANIVENAVRYAGECRISTHETRSHVEMYFDDNGPGIASEHRAVVFRPFTRLEPSRNQTTGGVGLGLTIARDIVLAHGGEILLADGPGGSGLRVTVRLPV